MSERRKIDDDRRVIPRYTDNELVVTLRQQKKWLKLLSFTCLFIGLFESVYSLFFGITHIARGIFYVVIVAIMVVLIRKYIYTINLYIENNSQNNMRRYHEAQNNIFAYLSFLILITFVASIFLRF